MFNVLISNTDDHLRNHGFLYEGGRGWRLSPAYDLNPVPVEVRPRTLSVAITIDDPTASLSLAMEVADYFDLSATEARRIAWEVGVAVSELAPGSGPSRHRTDWKSIEWHRPSSTTT